jgi:hypothetical protein
LTVNIKILLHQWVDIKGITIKSIVNYFKLSEPAFYAKLKNNRIYLHEVEKLADFFGVSLIEFLRGPERLDRYLMEPPGLNPNAEKKEMQALKNEVAYLKKIVQLYEKKEPR